MNTGEASASIAFRVHAIPPRTLAEIRLAGHDRFGNELTPIVDGGAPLPPAPLHAGRADLPDRLRPVHHARPVR